MKNKGILGHAYIHKNDNFFIFFYIYFYIFIVMKNVRGGDPFRHPSPFNFKKGYLYPFPKENKKTN